jgi:adenylate kinase family enzyme
MKRVLVIGSPGAGKSTFSAELGRIIKLPVIHLDKEFWQPGWVMSDSDEWRERVSELVAGDEWIVDGSYDGTLDIRLPRADTVVFLDYPRYLCLWRIFKRVATGLGHVRFDMGEGCPEHVDFGFIKWIWNYRRDHYPRINEMLEKYFNKGNLIILGSPAEAKGFMAKLK